MAEESMLKLGGVFGIIAGILWLAFPFIVAGLIMGGAITAAVWAIIVYPVILGIFEIIFSIGFYGGATKFGKGTGTAAFILLLLAGIFTLLTWVLLFLGIIIAGILLFIFSILAIVYFSGLPKGGIGLAGSILVLIGGILSFLIFPVILIGIGFILQGISLFMQASA